MGFSFESAFPITSRTRDESGIPSSTVRWSTWDSRSISEPGNEMIQIYALRNYTHIFTCQCMFIGFWFSHSCLHDSWTPWVFTFPLFTPWRSLPPPVGWWSVVVHLDHLVDHGNDKEETRDHGHVKVWQPPVFSMVETPKARNSMLKKAWSAEEW